MKDIVLIAEDDPKFLKLLKDVFEQCTDKLEMVGVENGEEAINVLKRDPISLLVTDMQMPKMNGRQLIAEVHKQDSLANLPIIIISGYVRLAEIDDLLKSGAMAFLNKPLKLDELEGYINSALKDWATAPGNP